MKRKHEVVGIDIDTEKEADKCSFLPAALDYKIKNFTEISDFRGNRNEKGHIARSKIKDMCIMPPFVMRDILKVIRASETAEVGIPLWEVIPGEYEEYAHQVLNSNAGKKRFDYSYISHRPFRSGDVYWIMDINYGSWKWMADHVLKK